MEPIGVNQVSKIQPSGRAQLECRWERFQDVANELLILSRLQQAEVGENYQPYNPDWSRYFAMDRAGSCGVWTARPLNHGALVGYIIWLTFRGLHCLDTIFASADLIYMSPEWRDGLRGYKFLKSGIAAVAAQNPDIIHVETNLLYKQGGMGLLLQRLGFRKIGEVYERRNDSAD